MKFLLWTVLALCLVANIFLSLAVTESATQIVLSIVAGVGVLGCGAGRWFLRDRHPA